MGQMKELKNARRGGKIQKGDRAAESDGWRGYVNVELSEAHKGLVRELAKQSANVWEVIWDLVDAGYKLSVSSDPRHNSYNVSLTCKALGDKNHGLTLTGRGGSVMGAAASFVFKHENLLEGDWSKEYQPTLPGIDEDFVG